MGQAAYGFDILSEDVEARIDDVFYMRLYPFEVGRQRLDGGVGIEFLDLANTFGVMRRTAVGQVITIDRRNDDVFEAHQTDGTRIWPPSDIRDGAIPLDRESVNITATDALQTSFHIHLQTMVAGAAGETTFALLTDTKVYSVLSDVTISMLGKEAVSVLSDAGHGLLDRITDIAAVTKTTEPMFFEFTSVKEAIAWAASVGDENGDALAWGVRLDDQNILFVEVQDFATVDYVIRRTGQIGVSTAAVFALIAFQLALNNAFPRVAYLTRADIYVLGSTLLVFIALAESIWTGRLARKGQIELAHRIDVAARSVYAILFVVLALFTAFGLG